MPPVLFPSSTAPGKDYIESAGRLINAYAEKLQSGGPAQHVIRRTPGLTLFGESSQNAFRGIWYDGSTAVYAAYTSNLTRFDNNGTATSIGAIPDGSVAYSGIFGSTTNASSYTLTSVPFGDAEANRRMVVGVATMAYEEANLIANGTFTANLSSWIQSGVSWDAGSGNGYAAFDDPGSGFMSQDVATVAGATYRISVRFRQGTRFVGTTQVYWNATTLVMSRAFSAATTTLTATVTASSTLTSLYIPYTVTFPGSGPTAGVDDITIVRINQFALPTAVTIGGVAATSVVSNSNAALWIANVPTTTSGSVVFTYANTMNETSVMVWRLDNAASDTPTDTVSHATIGTPAIVDVASGSVSVFLSQYGSAAATLTPSGITLNATSHPSTYIYYKGFSGRASATGSARLTSNATHATVGATWAGALTSLGNGLVTFAKNNKVPTPDQVMCISGTSLVPFTSAAISAPINVNSEIPTSVCFGEGYFFVTTTLGRCYASAINDTTFNSLESIRAEQRPESLTRAVFVGGELFLFGPTHTEVWASRGNPNATGFPLNYVTSISRGIVGTLAVTGYEEGFEGGMFWVADDDSVRMLQGYQPKIISTPALERAIALCSTPANIRMMCYDVDGHACVVIDICGEATWVYDITEGGLWHERSTADEGYWRATGNSVRAFGGKWICGDHDSGDLYQIDETARDDGGEAMPFIVESIAMEAFPARLKVSRAEFNFISGVGNAAVPNPEVEISWSDTGGHRWVDPLTRKLGEDGRYYEQVRVNGLGMTGVKGRRFRLRIDDEVEVGLLAGSMEVATL